jgi:hypothetical protein
VTFRDKSADVTLDNANEELTSMKRVEVNAYSNNAVRKEDGRFYMAREVDAEIDALKTEVAHWKANHDNMVSRSRVLIDRTELPLERVKAFEQIEQLQSENAALKAENERLRKDAERYRFLREQNESPVDGDGAESFYVGLESVFDEGGWIGADLDSVIDLAMKDFSTTQKEEERDSSD